MKTWMDAFLALVLLMIFLCGCAGVVRDTKVKCQRCGASFAVNEGVEDYRRADRGGETRIKVGSD
jgi:hypothetical protein